MKRALHELADAGFVKKEARFREKNRGQTSNLYTLVQPEDFSEPLEEKTPEVKRKQEDKAVCTVEHLTSETLKAERQSECEMETAQACEMTDTIVEQEQTQALDRGVEQNHRELQWDVPEQHTRNIISPAYTGKVRRPVLFPFQWRTLPVLLRWTWVGFNLQPP